jgi:hypothetical protein
MEVSEEDPLSDDSSTRTKTFFEDELKQAHDPNLLLVRWCLEGRPRITAALAEEGSLVRLAAQLLSEPVMPLNFPLESVFACVFTKCVCVSDLVDSTFANTIRYVCDSMRSCSIVLR